MRPGLAGSQDISGEDRRIVDLTLHTKPRGATHWSTRTLAREMGVSNDRQARIWEEPQDTAPQGALLQAERDPEFNEKVRDVVGLYMNPPDKAIVICVDEKPGVQALERNQTILPVRPGMPASRSYDYKRNGRIDLFAALNILDGTVITEFHKRHRHQEFLIFLRTIDGCVPRGARRAHGDGQPRDAHPARREEVVR